MQLLKSRHFFRHQDWTNWLMSYASFVIIWHLMSYDTYDIKIWRKVILTILVSKEAFRPQQLQELILLLSINCFKMFKLKRGLRLFFLYKNEAACMNHLGFWKFTCHFIHPKGMGLSFLLIHTKSWCIQDPPNVTVNLM